MATVLCEWLLNAALRFSFRLVLCVKVNTAILLMLTMHVHRQCKKVDTGMQCKYVSSHIALGVLLAGGQPLVVAPLFAVNALGGLNCTKVILNLAFVRVVTHHELPSDLVQVLLGKDAGVIHLHLSSVPLFGVLPC